MKCSGVVSGSSLAVATLIGLMGSVCSAAEPVWRHLALPQIIGAPHFVDLDGDGESEIVFQGVGSIGVLDDDGTGLRLIQLEPLLGVPRGGLVPVTQPDGRTTLLIGVSSDDSLDTIVHEYGNKPLRLLRSFLVEGAWQVHQVADVQAAGGPSMLVTEAGWSFSKRPALMSYLDGSLVWLSPVSTAGGIFAAQLDEEPGLEIIAAVSSGLVALDHETGELAWQFPVANAPRLLPGNFLGHAAPPSFAGVGHSPPLARVFRGPPYSLVRDIQVPSSRLSAYDVTGDGVDELIAARQAVEDSVQVIRTSDGAVIQNIPSPPGIVGDAIAGRLDGTSSLLLAHATGSGAGRPAGMLVRELASGQVRFWNPQESGARAVAFGASGEGGIDRVYLLQLRSGLNPALQLIDLEGTWQTEHTVDLGLNFEPGGMRLAVADVDGVPGDEVVAFQARYASGRALTLLDGLSHEVRWTVPSSIGGTSLHEIHAIRFADFDGDGLADVILAVAGLGGLGGRLVVLSGLDGSLIWQSIVHSHQTSTLGLKVARFGEGQPEKVVFTTIYTAYVYDVQSRTVDWVISPAISDPISQVEVWGLGEQCRLGLLINYQQFAMYRCDNQTGAGIVPLPGGTEFVAPVGQSGNLLLAEVGGRLQLLNLAGQLKASSEFIGGGVVAGGNALRPLPEEPGAVEVLVGSGIQAVRLRFDVSTIFRAGFELVN